MAGLDEFSRLYHRFIEGEYDVTDSEREALRAFLFSCFTGLRCSDLKGLSPHDRVCVYLMVNKCALLLILGSNWPQKPMVPFAECSSKMYIEG